MYLKYRLLQITEVKHFFVSLGFNQQENTNKETCTNSAFNSGI